ncbi:Mannitol-1-phosphate dehydrogenase, related [Eimeria mitis]|uniref:Mannitol-1-phosphate dehydrogenase, related n=1 Tax=Eimeria mitis TaxID=44415 RepID=U6JZP0_9EIME|nr:Mannitol-1-phosphate dehydrogenase, related [Eimeria mitis]CDJ30945.1 Mannitol-1-phosphate dehydrogenase, related [Eimeria mitis]
MALAPSEAPSPHEADGCHLGRPIFEFLDHPAILRFRKDYQHHRLGRAKGAKGEVCEALKEVEQEKCYQQPHQQQQQEQQQQQQQQQAHAAPLPEGISEDDAESLLSPFGAYDADSPFHRDEQLLIQIARWRMAYQRFRELQEELQETLRRSPRASVCP